MRLALLVLLAGAAGFAIALAAAPVRHETRTATVVRTETRLTRVTPTVAAPLPRSSASLGMPFLESLIPRNALVDGAWPIPPAAGIPAQVAVTWTLASQEEPWNVRGLAVWQRTAPAGWRPVYAWQTASAGLRVEVGDATGDGHRDLLVFSDTGGSCGNGVYRLLASVGGRIHGLFVRSGCADNMQVHLRGDALVAYDGRDEDPRTKRFIHCCWRLWQVTARRWDGARPLPPVVTWTRRRPAGFPSF